MSRSWPPDMLDAFFRFYADGEFNDAVVLPTVREITGREPQIFKQWVKAHVDDFRSSDEAVAVIDLRLLQRAVWQNTRKTGAVSSAPPEESMSSFLVWRRVSAPFALSQEHGKRLFEIDAAAATLSAKRCEPTLF
ncbi:MAG TPA: hypothetical protein VGK64_16190 [Bryobacteraceae bacterium]